jgi:hypothetical protein
MLLGKWKEEEAMSCKQETGLANRQPLDASSQLSAPASLTKAEQLQSAPGKVPG